MSEQEQADRAAWEGELFRLLVENVKDYAIFVIDENGLILSWSHGSERLLGYREEEILKRPISLLFTPEDVAKGEPEREIRRALANGRGEDDRWHVRKDGTRFWASGVMTPLRDENGGLRGLAKIMRDLTDWWYADQARKESEERLRTVFAHAAVGIAVMDATGKVLEVNDAFTAITGFEAAEILDKSIFSVVHPDDLPQKKALLGHLLSGDNPGFVVEIRIVRKNGEIGRVKNSVSAGRDELGRPLRIVALIEDVTAAKIAEEQVVRLTEEAERQRRIYETALSNTADCNYVFDLRARLVFANRSLLKLWGKNLPEVLGKNFVELGYPVETAERLIRQIEQVIQTKRPLRDEFVYASGIGPRNYEYILMPVLNEAGSAVAVTGSARDITDRKQMEEVLRRQTERLLEADRRKDEFLATLAHELRNPLAPIRNALHLMRRTEASAIEAERAMAERQVVHLARLIDDLMDVARISQGKIELHKSVVDLGVVVHQAVETARPQIDERRHKLVVSPPEEPIALEADPTRLEQILWNLLNNAAKYTEPGGVIRLAVEPEGEEVVIRVIDNGIGIAPEMLPRVFDMFVQVGDHRHHAQGGLGIGLSLVRTLVQMHGGSIAAKSEGPGKGSEFTIRLPVLARGIETERKAVDSPRKTLLKPPCRRILVVDDNRDGARSLARVLTKLYGQEVRIALDGPEALIVADDFRPDVIFLDIGLPGLNGYDVSKTLRDRDEFQKTLIVALTGWGGQEDDKRLAREAGIDLNLVKPVDPETLRELLLNPDAFPKE